MSLKTDMQLGIDDVLAAARLVQQDFPGSVYIFAFNAPTVLLLVAFGYDAVGPFVADCLKVGFEIDRAVAEGRPEPVGDPAETLAEQWGSKLGKDVAFASARVLTEAAVGIANLTPFGDEVVMQTRMADLVKNEMWPQVVLQRQGELKQ